MDKAWLNTCITAGELLYGEYPVEVLKQLYETRGGKTDTAEITECFDGSSMMVCDGKTVSPQIVSMDPILSLFKEADKEGNAYASLHFDPAELEVLRKENAVIADQPYWIPTASQIEELTKNGYIRTPQFSALEKAIVDHKGNPAVLSSLWAKISTGKMEMMEGFQNILDESGLVLGNKYMDEINDLNTLIPTVMAFENSINSRLRKGWAPSELGKRMPKYHGMPTIMPASAEAARRLKEAEPDLRAIGANVDYSSIDSYVTTGPYGERRVTKIGRNDPCPCGSGKKYKHCHGR